MIQWTCFYLSRLAYALLELQWPIQSLGEPLVLSLYLRPLLQGILSLFISHLPSSYLALPLDAIGAIFHHFGLLRTYRGVGGGTKCSLNRDVAVSFSAFLLMLKYPLSKKRQMYHHEMWLNDLCYIQIIFVCLRPPVAKL